MTRIYHFIVRLVLTVLAVLMHSSLNALSTASSSAPGLIWSPDQSLLFVFEPLHEGDENGSNGMVFIGTRFNVFFYDADKKEFLKKISTVVPIEVTPKSAFLIKDRMLVVLSASRQKSISIIDLISKKCFKEYSLEQIIPEAGSYNFGGLWRAEWFSRAFISEDEIMIVGGELHDENQVATGRLGPGVVLNTKEFTTRLRP